jgi:hypothetical protein
MEQSQHPQYLRSMPHRCEARDIVVHTARIKKVGTMNAITIITLETDVRVEESVTVSIVRGLAREARSDEALCVL